MKLKIMEWNIHQQGRQWNGKTQTSNDGDIPLWIIDQISDDISIVVLTEFNSHAKNTEEFYNKLMKKGFFYSSTNYSCGWANDILIAVRGDAIVENVSFVKAYPDSPNTTFNIDWDAIPENIRVDIRIEDKLVHLWGIRIKDLKSNYEKRNNEMEMLVHWIKEVDGINYLVGDFNNLREDTHITDWNLIVLDNLLGANFERITPKNHSWGVSKLVSDNTFDGYIKNDHFIYSKGDIKSVTAEEYKWTYLKNCQYTLEEGKFGKNKLNIPVGEPDHGILIVEVYI